jgi:hypothetical protein
MPIVALCGRLIVVGWAFLIEARGRRARFADLECRKLAFDWLRKDHCENAANVMGAESPFLGQSLQILVTSIARSAFGASIIAEMSALSLIRVSNCLRLRNVAIVPPRVATLK